MTHRVLLKLDVLKRYEKKKLSKYDMTECRNLGKVQFNPYLRTPLLLNFKLDYESSRDAKSNISAVPSTQHIIQCNRSPFQQRGRPQSGSSAQINRKNYSGKPVRPLSAPSYLEHKPSDQRGNLQSLDGGFMILKLTPKVKPALWKTTEVQKKGVPEQCFINYLYAGTSSQDRAMTVTAEKGQTTDQALIDNEGSNQAAQEAPGSESQVKFCINGNLSSDNLKARKDTLLKGYITKKEEETKKSFIHYTDMDLKNKAYIPLCIEDEIEKPDAKVIRAGCPKKSHIPMKMSESFPVLHHNEEYMEKYVLNRWLALYGNKAFYDMNKRGEVCTHLNPVLQNNYDESIAIIESRKSPPSKITAKKKKKPKFSGKPKHITIQILSVEKAPRYVPLSSQKTAPFLQKIHRRITRTVSRHNVVGRHIQQKIPESNKDSLMIHGVNPQSNKYPHISSSVLVSRVKSQLPIFFEKQFTSVEELHQKGRMIFVDYIPISKPIPIQPSGEGPLGQAPNSAIVGDSTQLRPMEINQPEMYHQDTFEQKQVDERKSGDIDFIAHEHLSSVQKSSERSSRSTSSLSFRGFETEENNSHGAQKSGTLVKYSEDKHIASTHCPVISIPTAQFETSELHRDQNVQEFNDI